MSQQRKPQPYFLEDQPTYVVDDDIDLRELFKALWNGRLLIVLISALFTIGSVGFALSAQEWWSSKAKITEAQSQDLAAYQNQVKQFQPIFNIYQEDGTVLISEELVKLVDSKVLFENFVNTFNATNNKRIFLDSSAEFQKGKEALSIDGPEVTEDTARNLYYQWFNKIRGSISDKGDRNSPYYLSFQTKTPQSSFDLLTSYILVTENKVQQDAFNNLQAVVNGKRNELIQQKKIIETQAKNQLLVETERAKYAVKIARAAGVDKPIQTGSGNELFSIDLGLKGLEAKVQALESIRNLSIIEPRLQQINAKLDMLSTLKIDRNIEFKTFRFLENVEQPVTRDKPKRTLIVIFGAFLGGILGAAIVLVRFSFRREC
ncbi:LPS O-antigen chain length determinant protein WzzB [Vibrio coralliirubri]|uniref:LPS O-antigen chain length determinant protein WzzB n=1 Tax=Vibrio coralliirubri TaxID=1516159 RepID=UPI00069AEAFC|nr:Wzz/FepE/Etk N-terminal domain-containing protein [Vibrio coralliirubri]